MRERLLKLYEKHSRLWEASEGWFKRRLYHTYMCDRIANIVFERYAIALDGPRG